MPKPTYLAAVCALIWLAAPHAPAQHAGSGTATVSPRRTSMSPLHGRAAGTRAGAAATATINGTVLDGKRLLAGASITCRQGSVTIRFHSDLYGSLHQLVPPGRYSCVATAPKHNPSQPQVVVARAHKTVQAIFILSLSSGLAAPTGTSQPVFAPTSLPGGGNTSSRPTGSETCSWNLNTRNTGTDSNAIYWQTALQADPGVILTVAGTYPAARYASLEAYTVPADALVASLHDAAFPPDSTTGNPFATGKPRGTGTFAVRVVFGPRPVAPARGTLYVDVPQGTVVALVYRVVLPDSGALLNGSVQPPTATAQQERTGLPAGCPASSEGTLQPSPPANAPILGSTATVTAGSTVSTSVTTTTTTPLPTQSTPSAIPSPSPTVAVSDATGFTRRTAANVEGIGNDNAAYLETTLEPQAELYVVRFKAPTTPRTLAGGPIGRTAQLRYWSLCSYDVTSRPRTCLVDEQAPVDRQGIVTVVLGRLWARPPAVTAGNGVAWMDLNAFILPYRLVLRQLLPAPGFTQSAFAVPIGARPDAYMGPYAPTITACTLAHFQLNRCAP